MAISRKGKEARTRYQVEERFEEPAPTTLVRASLETGRTHQIRVHLSAIGHPVVGDEPYSQGRSLPGATVTRPFLHAYALAFDHPTTWPLSWRHWGTDAGPGGDQAGKLEAQGFVAPVGWMAGLHTLELTWPLA